MNGIFLEIDEYASVSERCRQWEDTRRAADALIHTRMLMLRRLNHKDRLEQFSFSRRPCGSPSPLCVWPLRTAKCSETGRRQGDDLTVGSLSSCFNSQCFFFFFFLLISM